MLIDVLPQHELMVRPIRAERTPEASLVGVLSKVAIRVRFPLRLIKAKWTSVLFAFRGRFDPWTVGGVEMMGEIILRLAQWRLLLLVFLEENVLEICAGRILQQRQQDFPSVIE